MSRVLLAWELGGGTGHLRKLAFLARELRERGHEVIVTSRDLAVAERVCTPHAIAAIQSPFWHTRPGFSGLPQSFPEIVAELGFFEVDFVTGLVRAWLQLFELTAPDFVIGDYAPGAFLAAHIAGVSHARLGTGFTCPPSLTPYPPVLLRKGSTAASLEKIEARVLDTVNRAAKRLSHPGFATLADTQRGARDYLATFPEMDHYGTRRDADYVGVYDTGQSEVEPQWPNIDAPKLFVYYHPGYPRFAPLVEALAALDASVLLVTPGILPAIARRAVRRNVNVCARAVDLGRVATEADVCLTHGGHGVVAALLLLGCRQVIHPMYNEQKILGMRLKKQDLALVAEEPEAIAAATNAARDDPSLARRSAAFARRYREWTPKRCLDRLADDIEKQLQPAADTRAVH